ncbi:hypothetical protein [Qingshengfaniella alkalisoli]|uniref:Uncharacterized protein n=1 Tax=Qingshengfaniella alkalisoli TaxID=2599296 RepID=A0A5B8J5W1_9RHOB|nr:hypothetical protein [Qingshengfaniella alkalisoli]QDY69720.1 hypothetical protein FPZ52_08870 [Qingshengfaniella alkalisoli]
MIREFLIVASLATPVFADPPRIVDAVADASGTVSVTLRHGDTGWDHYADGWRVETENGDVIGTRELLHAHENEQPFTRSLNLPGLPDEPIFIRAKCNVTGWAETRSPLTRR